MVICFCLCFCFCFILFSYLIYFIYLFSYFHLFLFICFSFLLCFVLCYYFILFIFVLFYFILFYLISQLSLSEYLEKFVANGFDTISLITMLEVSDLDSLGVEVRKKVIKINITKKKNLLK
jgi:hypothetical protein